MLPGVAFHLFVGADGADDPGSEGQDLSFAGGGFFGGIEQQRERAGEDGAERLDEFGAVERALFGEGVFADGAPTAFLMTRAVISMFSMSMSRAATRMSSISLAESRILRATCSERAATRLARVSRTGVGALQIAGEHFHDADLGFVGFDAAGIAIVAEGADEEGGESEDAAQRVTVNPTARGDSMVPKPLKSRPMTMVAVTTASRARTPAR